MYWTYDGESCLMSYFEPYIDHAAILHDFGNEREALDQLRETLLEHDGPWVMASLALVAVSHDERRTIVTRQQDLLELVRSSTLVS